MSSKDEETQHEETETKLIKDNLFESLINPSSISLISISKNQSMERTEYEMMKELSNLPIVKEIKK
jgi:hypothetical protein